MRFKVEMGNVEKLQQLIERFAECPYNDTYLWKYLEYELTSGLISDYQEQEKNTAIHGGVGDGDTFPAPVQEDIDKTAEFLEGLRQKEILFAMLPLRRIYKGRLEHTAMDAYVRTLDEDRYVVIEPDLGGQGDEVILTRNRKRFSPLGVIGRYGLTRVDRNEIVDFLVNTYVYPLEQAFGVKMPKQMVLGSIFKASMILQERKAYLAFFREVLDRVRPSVVCYSHGPDSTLCFLREAAQEEGIPTVEIAHGAMSLNMVYPKTLAYSDYYLIHSDLSAVPMLEAGWKNLYTIGKPDVYKEVHQGLKEGMPVVVSFISSMEKDFFLKALHLAKRLDKQKYLVVYKAHAAEKWEEKEVDKVLEENENCQFLDGTVDIRELFELSDIVVGVRSSGILDALPYNKIKIITLKDSNEKDLLVGNLSFFQKLEDFGDIIKVENEEQLYQEVIRYKRGEQFREPVNHYWPTDANERFVEFMDKF